MLFSIFVFFNLREMRSLARQSNELIVGATARHSSIRRATAPHDQYLLSCTCDSHRSALRPHLAQMDRQRDIAPAVHEQVNSDVQTNKPQTRGGQLLVDQHAQ